MPDDKNKFGEPVRSRASRDQDHEVRHLAETHALTVEQARMLIARFGNDRAKLDIAARQLSGAL